MALMKRSPHRATTCGVALLTETGPADDPSTVRLQRRQSEERTDVVDARAAHLPICGGQGARRRGRSRV